MEPILREIDDAIKSRGLKFKSVRFNYSLLSDYVNQAILYKIRELDIETTFSFGKETYGLWYDMWDSEADTMYIQGYTDNFKRRLLIVDGDSEFLDASFGEVVSLEEILENAYILKMLRPEQLRIRKELEEKYPDKCYLDRLKMEYKIVSSLLNEERTIRKERDGIILNSQIIEELLGDSIPKILESINSSYDTFNERENARKSIMDFEFTPLCDNSTSKKNDLISIDERMDVLDSIQYMFRGYGSSTDLDKSDYLCYLYKLNSCKYMLILTPVKGENYTRMVILNTPQYFLREDFKDMARSYLEMSMSQFMECENTMIFFHTTINSFIDIVECATRVDDTLYDINEQAYVVRRVRELKRFDKPL